MTPETRADINRHAALQARAIEAANPYPPEIDHGHTPAREPAPFAPNGGAGSLSEWLS